MKKIRIIAGVTGLAALGCSGESTQGDAFLKLDKNGKKPVNVVLFYLDDSGFADFSFNGAVGYTTPNVDYMATHGLRFTNYYAAQPISGASRSSLVTGCYANRVGLTGAPMTGSPYGLAEEEETIGEIMQANGYSTALGARSNNDKVRRFIRKAAVHQSGQRPSNLSYTINSTGRSAGISSVLFQDHGRIG